MKLFHPQHVLALSVFFLGCKDHKLVITPPIEAVPPLMVKAPKVTSTLLVPC